MPILPPVPTPPTSPVNSRFDDIIINAIGEAVSGCLVFVCKQPLTSTAIPPAPLADLWADVGGTIALDNPVTADGNGNFFFYTAADVYTLIYFDPFARIPTQIFPDQAVVTQGNGSVNAVALSMDGDGVIFNPVVPGSPISDVGTLSPQLLTQLANTVLAGPASGAVTTPTFRKLVAADITGLSPGVSSVNAAVTPGALFTASFSGGPITGSGTLQLVFDFNTVTANKVLAGPSSGGAGNISARSLVPADLPGMVSVSFSATPTFDASTGNSFKMTLTGNVTSSMVTNPTIGQNITFVLTQDGAGSHTFAWPANFKGASAISPDASGVSVQEFIYDGAAWRATSPGITMGS